MSPHRVPLIAHYIIPYTVRHSQFAELPAAVLLAHHHVLQPPPLRGNESYGTHQSALSVDAPGAQ